MSQRPNTTRVETPAELTARKGPVSTWLKDRFAEVSAQQEREAMERAYMLLVVWPEICCEEEITPESHSSHHHFSSGTA